MSRCCDCGGTLPVHWPWCAQEKEPKDPSDDMLEAIREHSRVLYAMLTTYRTLAGEEGAPLNPAVFMSALLTVAAHFLQGAPEAWRNDAIGQFVRHAEPNPLDGIRLWNNSDD